MSATPSPRSARKKRGVPSTAAQDLNAAQRTALALRLAIAGCTYEQIAERCGMANRSVAYKVIQRELQRAIKPPTEELRQMEVARLDAILAVQMAIALDHKNKNNGWAADRVVRISESRRKLLGLDLPPASAMVEQQMILIGVPQEVIDAV